MTRAQKERRILALVKKYVPLLLLEHWQISVEFYESRDDLKRATRGAEDFAAGSNADPEYGKGRIAFVLDEWDEATLEEVVLHELTHLPLFEMSQTLDRWAGADEERKETVRDRTERATGHMTRVVGRLLGVRVSGVVRAPRRD